MAEFKLAIPRVITNEGGYVNDPDVRSRDCVEALL